MAACRSSSLASRRRPVGAASSAGVIATVSRPVGETSRKLQMTDQLGAGGLHQDFGALMARQLLETVASID